MSTPLLALTLAVVAIGLRWLATRRSRADRRRLAEPSLLERYVRLPREAVPIVRMGLLGLGVVALVLASASGGAEARRTDPEGMETVLVLDASNSMLAEDMGPSRLEVQRQLAGRLATRLGGRLGVVYFAGRAYVLSPLTTDVSAIEMLVEGVRPTAVGLGGSSLAAGLTQAIDLLAGGEEEARKVIVVFSDGEETVAQSVTDAVERARRAGIVIHTVGIGTRDGGQIPITREASVDPSTAARRRGGGAVLTDGDGEPVLTRLEDGVLREVADETGGRYLPGDAAADDIERQVAAVSREPLSSAGDAAVGILLVLAFVSLWGEGFLLPRG